ncbi:hypothetical protein KAT21_02365 [Candidatus Bathyarchaeota archaeon]|nr:hypothetical protein [Candidatus Bathyarchaeota archaeon]
MVRLKRLKVSIQRWGEVDVHELAKLACAALVTTYREDLTTARLENWLNRLEFDFAPVAVQARSAGELVGWLLLFMHDGKRAEINPWALNGHPLVSPRRNLEKSHPNLSRRPLDMLRGKVWRESSYPFVVQGNAHRPVRSTKGYTNHLACG